MMMDGSQVLRVLIINIWGYKIRFENADFAPIKPSFSFKKVHCNLFDSMKIVNKFFLGGGQWCSGYG